MIKIVIQLECNENTFNLNMGRVDKYATDDVEKKIGKKYFDKLKEILKNIDIDSLVKECLKDSKKEILSKILNEKELDKLVDEILNNDKELKNIGKESIKKILDEIMEED